MKIDETMNLSEKYTAFIDRLDAQIRLKKRPANLTYLDLNGRGIDEETFPFIRFYIEKRNWNITILDLSFNRFSVLPDLSFLPNLKTLFVYKAGLKDVISLSLLQNLKYVTLAGNDLTEIPDLAVTNPKLRLINLKNNRLKKIPEMPLPKLKDLYLTGNPIRTVPLSYFPKLETIHLTLNKEDWKFPDYLLNQTKDDITVGIKRCKSDSPVQLLLSQATEDRGTEDRDPEYRGPEYRGPEYRGPVRLRDRGPTYYKDLRNDV